MENATKALLIAAGTLLGVMLLGLVIYFFNTISVLPQEKEIEQKVEQIAKFNTEYQSYDKKIMYGVDVISALNKAKSNNEKYIEGSFFSGNTYTNEYIVDVWFKINTPLEDSITVSYLLGSASSSSRQEYDYATGQGPNGIYIKDIFKLPSTNYNSINDIWAKPFQTNTYRSKFNKTGDYYKLLKNENSPKSDEMVEALLNSSDAIRQQKKNNTNNIEEKLKTNGGWSSAEWKTSLYDLKSRKFTCKEVGYNEATGRINKLVFDEYTR